MMLKNNTNRYFQNINDEKKESFVGNNRNSIIVIDDD